MNVKIRNKFIEIKYSVSNGLVIFITNYWWFRILEISRYRRSIIFVHAGCIAVHDECEFIYGQCLWICIQDMQVNMPCV